MNPQFTDGTTQADGQSRHLPAIPGNRVVLDPTDLMPEQQVAVIQRKSIPFIEIHLDLHFIPANLLKGDEGRIDCSS